MERSIYYGDEFGEEFEYEVDELEIVSEVFSESSKAQIVDALLEYGKEELIEGAECKPEEIESLLMKEDKETLIDYVLCYGGDEFFEDYEYDIKECFRERAEENYVRSREYELDPYGYNGVDEREFY